MINDKKIDAGDNSTNIQAENVNVQKGLSYLDVKEVAMDVFKSNFYKLGEKVDKIINERAEDMINKYLEKLKTENPDLINKTEDPDMRYVIYEAQRSHARRGNKDIEELLTDLLIKRTKNDEESLKKLVLNESLDTIPKLTLKQIDILSIIFLCKYTQYNALVPISIFIDIIYPIKKDIVIKTNDLFYQHLEFSGCLSVSVASVPFKNLIQSKFPQIKNEEEAAKTIESNPYLSSLQAMWNNTKLCNCSLTSVGIAIALSNIKVKTNQELDLGIWINE